MTKPDFVSLDTDPQVLDRAALAAGGRLPQVLDKKRRVNKGVRDKEDSAPDLLRAMRDEQGEHGITRTLNNNKEYDHIVTELGDGRVVGIVPNNLKEKQKPSQVNDIGWNNIILSDKQVATSMPETPVTIL